MAFLSLAVTLAAACSSPPAATGSGGPPNSGAESRPGPVDDTLHIQLGRSAAADGGRLTLTFVARLSDSRCPANVVCVWMGNAAVRVAARVGGASLEHELHTGLEPRSFTVDRYVVTLVGLLPYPGADSPGTTAAPPTVVVRITHR